MKRKRFSEEQIIGVLKEHEAGTTIVEPVPPPWRCGTDDLPLEVEVRWHGGV